jgi:uncharacterized protein (TIGR03435 family)
LLPAVLLAAPFLGFGQPSRKLEFEVASVKPTAIDSAMWSRQARAGTIRVGKRINGDRAEYTFMSLRQLIVEAYQVRSFQVVASDRLPAGRFDVVGKMPAGSRKEDAPLMLQSLLADRFKLVVHRESREQGVAALVVGKGGPKLKESPSEEPLNPGDTKGAAPEGAGQATPGQKGTGATMTLGTVGYHLTVDLANSSFHLEASRMTMGDLAELLMKADAGNGRAVVDMTGLEGNYEVILDIPMAAVEGIAATGAAVADDAQGPRPAEAASDPGNGRMLRSLKSLGLELENRKAPVEQLIVDHAEKMPTEN